ncbi:MAG: hypothetical protein KTR25_11005 [Myxococcales bacterium]|nr:hypothetical protein [Myxococcales bacterium]
MANMLDALVGGAPFNGFAPADFDAFERKKWSSRVYTKERRVALQKLVVIGRSLKDVVPEVDYYEVGTSDDAPSMINNRQVRAAWLYITRPSEARTALSSRLLKTNLSDASALFDISVEHQHACILFAIDLERILLEIHISPRAVVDRMNAARKLSYQEDREALSSLFGALSPEAQVGFEDQLLPAPDITRETIQDWESVWSTSQFAFVVRLGWSRSDQALEAATFGEEIKERFSQLWPIFAFLAWSSTNDFAKVVVEKTIERVEKKLKKNITQVNDCELNPGTRVTILSGLFAGRAGYVAELDGKGQAKVMVGPVSVSVSIQDVKPS